MKERLQKILAKAGVCSRRAAEELIRQGKVKVDGKIVTQMGLQLDAEAHSIECNGKEVLVAEKPIYILLNKPRGYVTTLNDPQGRPIVTELIPEIQERVFPVGRLDLDTEGALLLTNDGEFADRVLHPRHEVFKTYLARVKGHPSQKKLSSLRRGIEVDGRKTSPARVKIIATKAAHSDIEIIIHEGRKRQVRKMFEAVGHRVLELKRLAYGSLRLGKMGLGKYRILSPKDIEKIFI